MSAMLVIDDPDFVLTLPAGWKARPDRAPDDYTSADEVEQVLVSRGRFASALSPSELDREIGTVIEARREAVTRMSKGLGMLAPVTHATKGVVKAAEFVGSDPVAKVLIYGRIVASPVKIVTVSVYRYGDIGDPKGFVARAEPICRSLVLRDQ
jgi:hypothetical protein